jgi:hypothetical protein
MVVLATTASLPLLMLQLRQQLVLLRALKILP